MQIHKCSQKPQTGCHVSSAVNGCFQPVSLQETCWAFATLIHRNYVSERTSTHLHLFILPQSFDDFTEQLILVLFHLVRYINVSIIQIFDIKLNNIYILDSHNLNAVFWGTFPPFVVQVLNYAPMRWKTRYLATIHYCQDIGGLRTVTECITS